MALVVKPSSEVPKPVPVELPKKKAEKGKVSSTGNLMDVLAGIRKDKGDKVVVAGNKIPVVRRLPTGIFEFDFYTGGGFPCGRYSIVYGPECLDELTPIAYEVRNARGDVLQHERNTLLRMAKQFHRAKSTQADQKFMVPSVNLRGQLVPNEVLNVIDAGTKDCWTMTTANGHTITASADHEFWTGPGQGFKKLADLKVEDTIFVHLNVPRLGWADVPEGMKVVYVKHTTTGTLAVRRESPGVYRSLMLSRQKAMGVQNQSQDTFMMPPGFVFPDLIPDLDEIEAELDPKLPHVAVPERIVTKEHVGPRHCYDLQMADPFHNYVAAGFVVHNSSNKTNLCLKAVANAQKQPAPCNKAIWVNVEQSFDPVWAEKMGVDTTQLLVVNAGYGEEAIDLVDALVRAEDVAILVVDSMAGLIASKEIAQSVENYDIGTSALLIKRMVNKLMIAFCEEQKREHDPCVILINQTRFKPGVMFGDPETMPGGEAQKFLSSLRVRVYAKNIIDKATNTLVFKDTTAVIKKAKVPVRATSFDFKLCVHAHDDLAIGETDSFNMVKSHLQALNLLMKTPKGYALNGKEFPTLTAMQDRYAKDHAFKMKLQGLVIESYKDKLILVEESDYSPKEVPAGTPIDLQPIANGNGEPDGEPVP